MCLPAVMPASESGPRPPPHHLASPLALWHPSITFTALSNSACLQLPANFPVASASCISSCRELPEGPYLDGLRTLLLDCNELTRLPPVLQRAKQLEVLDLFQSPCQDHPGVHLELGDLGLLCGMPLLRLLCVPGRDLPSWRIALLFRTWLPRLSCECHHSAASLDSLFPSGWDNGMDEAVFAERLEADRVNSLAVSGSVLRTLGRWLA